MTPMLVIMMSATQVLKHSFAPLKSQQNPLRRSRVCAAAPCSSLRVEPSRACTSWYNIKLIVCQPVRTVVCFMQDGLGFSVPLPLDSDDDGRSRSRNDFWPVVDKQSTGIDLIDHFDSNDCILIGKMILICFVIVPMCLLLCISCSCGSASLKSVQGFENECSWGLFSTHAELDDEW